MLLGMMVTAKGESIMVAMTTVPRIRKRYIFVFIVAYPVATAFSLYQIFRFATEPAPKFWLFLYGFIFMLCCHFLFVLERQNFLAMQSGVRCSDSLYVIVIIILYEQVFASWKE
jgi:hypothetical protein